MALRTAGKLFLPVNGKVFDLKGIWIAFLPVRPWAGWANHLNLMNLKTVRHDGAADITGIDEMLPRQHLFFCKCLVNCVHQLDVLHAGRRNLNMSNQFWKIGFTGFSEVDFVAYPAFSPLGGEASFWIVGRFWPLR